MTTVGLDAWIPRLAGRTAEQRAELPGISAARARQIVAGAVVARATMKALDVSHVDVCPWALREGVILRYLQTTMDTAQCMPLRPVRRRTDDDQAPVRVLTSAP